MGKTIYSLDETLGGSLVIDLMGNIIVNGYFSESTDFGTGLSTFAMNASFTNAYFQS